VPAYLPYVQPPLTAEAVASAENELGVSLPNAYLDILREQNGGYVRLTFEGPNTVHTQIWGIGPYFPSIAVPEWWREHFTSDGRDGQQAGKQSLVPFDGDGHWFLCLDYRKNGPRAEPSVTVVDLECNKEQEVAESFLNFLGMLKRHCHSKMLGISGVESVDSIVNDLNAAFGIKFDELSSWAHGYPQHRWLLGPDAIKEWAWLSPNRVSRGFVRESDARYSELADLMPGTALRYPEYPDVQFLLTFTDGAADRIKAACAGASYSTRPIP
jgi:hypothetical protein